MQNNIQKGSSSSTSLSAASTSKMSSKKSNLENWLNLPPAMQICIQNCTDCYQMCSHLVDHCLSKGANHADSAHIKLLLDCARVCNLSADLMIRHSEFRSSVCEVCADVCTACAVSCESFEKDDAMMQACAEICRKCASSCDQMAKH